MEKLIHLGKVAVIGKCGKSTDDEGFVQKLWEEANGHFNEVEALAKKDENGKVAACWGAMSDMGLNFKPWEDWFKTGLYLAGVEVNEDAIAPEGWTKWVMPERDYLVVSVDMKDYSNTFNHYVWFKLDFLLYDLVGAACDYTIPETGENFIYFPVQKREMVVHDEDETDKIAYCGNHCGYCFFPKCGGCKTNENWCSYAFVQPDKKCGNAECCKEKGFKGCWECEDLINCNKAFYQDKESTAKAAALFIQREGLKAAEDTSKKIILEGINLTKTLSEQGDTMQKLEFLYKYYHKYFKKN